MDVDGVRRMQDTAPMKLYLKPLWMPAGQEKVRYGTHEALFIVNMGAVFAGKSKIRHACRLISEPRRVGKRNETPEVTRPQAVSPEKACWKAKRKARSDTPASCFP